MLVLLMLLPDPVENLFTVISHSLIVVSSYQRLGIFGLYGAIQMLLLLLLSTEIH